MRKENYPTWNNWQTAVESAIEDCLKQSELVGYRLDGTATNLNIPVKGMNQAQGNMPYVQVILAGIDNHWDADASGVLDPEGSKQTTLGGNKFIDQSNSFRERISFQIDIFGQKYDQVVAIAQTIRKYFGWANTFVLLLNGVRHEVACKLPADTYVMEATEVDVRGHIEYFKASWLFTLFITSEKSDDDKIIASITTVVLNEVDAIGDNESDERTKTI